MPTSETGVASRDSALQTPRARDAGRARTFREWLQVQSPILQTALAVTFVVALALSAGVALTVANFDRTLQTIVDSRFQYIAKELKNDVEKGLDLGLSLKEFSNAQQIIDQQIARNDDLVRVAITAPEGKVLFAATAGAESAPPDQRREVGADLVNPFGQQAGTVTVVYTTGGALNAVRDLAGHLAQAAGLIAGIAAAAAALACVAIMRRIPRSLLRAREALAQRDPPSSAGDQIERTSADAIAVSKATLDELGAILVEGPSQAKDTSR